MRIEFEDYRNEQARDQWIAISAAILIADGKPLSDVESEPLEALSDWIRAELLDRDMKDHKTLNLFETF